jgi:multiple sugar transport system substrate-binding protein
MPLTKKTIFAALAFGALLVFAVLIATGTIRLTKKIKKTELSVWGFDTPAAWEKITAKYHADHPEVTVTYRAISPAEYEIALLNGLAAGQGPDLFMIMDTWLPRHGNKMIPAPADIATTATFDANFPRAATEQLTYNGAAYALPLYMDTYAVIYNKDLFDKAGIAFPPSSWIGMQDLAKKLGKNSIALGGSEKTIEGASDIVAVMMMQDGVPMTNTDGTAKFQGGENALAFYAKFSNPKGGYYAWDNKTPTAFTRFTQGKLPLLIGTHAEAVALNAANPALRIGIAPLPQPPAGTPANLATYAALAVWNGGKNMNEAWRFAADITLNPENALLYASSANVPPAHRTLIERFQNDPAIGVFMRQALTARPWYRLHEGRAREILSSMIELVVSGASMPIEALRRAEQALDALYNNKPIPTPLP